MTPTGNYLAPLLPADKTSSTDDERIENIVPLPPPEHLIRFFPIQGTPVEQLIADTRRRGRASLHRPVARVRAAGRRRPACRSGGSSPGTPIACWWWSVPARSPTPLARSPTRESS